MILLMFIPNARPFRHLEDTRRGPGADLGDEEDGAYRLDGYDIDEIRFELHEEKGALRS